MTVFNWIPVAHSVADILSHAARIRAQSLSPLKPRSTVQLEHTPTKVSVQPVKTVSPPPVPTRHLQSSTVPSSKIGRLFHYGGLAVSLGYGVTSELIRRSATSSDSDRDQPPPIMTEANLNRLVSKLSQMRGAALKLGQFMSIQGTTAWQLSSTQC